MKILSIAIVALSMNIAHAKIFWGEKIPVGNGHAVSFIKTENGYPKEIGIAISEEATKGLDPHMMQEYILPLPQNVPIAPYKHITLDWNPMGHEPPGVYDRPHFDMHFYFITNAERQMISCMGPDAPVCTKPIPPEYIADNYAPTPGGVPKMGWHYVDLLAPEFNGGIFTRTFLFGYYNGQTIFLEPMITIASLKSRETTVKEIRQPYSYPIEDGYYPDRYIVYFDKKDNYYKILLTGFLNRGPKSALTTK